MPRKQRNTTKTFWLKDGYGVNHAEYKCRPKYNYWCADLEEVFFSLYMGLLRFDHPVVYRMDLNFMNGYTPAENNQEIKEFVKNAKSLFWRENTRFKGRSAFKVCENQPSEPELQYAKRFKPIIIWCKEKSTPTEHDKISDHGEVLAKYHYHIIFIAAIYHEYRLKERLRTLWDAVCEKHQKGSWAFHCRTNKYMAIPVGNYRLYNSDGTKVTINSNTFRWCFERCSYIAKTSQKSKLKGKRTVFGNKGYKACKKILMAEIETEQGEKTYADD